MIETFNYIGNINEENFMLLNKFISTLNKDVSTIKINISSFGGSTTTAIAIYNYLKRLPYKIITNNTGEVSSAALILYLAGQERYAEDNTRFLIHPILYNEPGKCSYFRAEEIIKILKADICNYSAIVNKETNNLNEKINIEYILQRESVVLNHTHARECGIVTHYPQL